MKRQPSRIILGERKQNREARHFRPAMLAYIALPRLRPRREIIVVSRPAGVISAKIGVLATRILKAQTYSAASFAIDEGRAVVARPCWLALGGGDKNKCSERRRARGVIIAPSRARRPPVLLRVSSRAVKKHREA